MLVQEWNEHGDKNKKLYFSASTSEDPDSVILSDDRFLFNLFHSDFISRTKEGMNDAKSFKISHSAPNSWANLISMISMTESEITETKKLVNTGLASSFQREGDDFSNLINKINRWQATTTQ